MRADLFEGSNPLEFSRDGVEVFRLDQLAILADPTGSQCQLLCITVIILSVRRYPRGRAFPPLFTLAAAPWAYRKAEPRISVATLDHI